MIGATPWYKLGRDVKVVHWAGWPALIAPVLWVPIFIGLSGLGLFRDVPLWVDRALLAAAMGGSYIALLLLKGRA
ncbi:MAG: hypothetical protein JNJ73_12465 [Hyphomonadaceae bacterium]|nr:hypothetical protein [Hyphomonadaceae bacterium]